MQMIIRIMEKGKSMPIQIFQYPEKLPSSKAAWKKSNQEQASNNSFTKENKTRRYCSNQKVDTKSHLGIVKTIQFVQKQDC